MNTATPLQIGLIGAGGRGSGGYVRYFGEGSIPAEVAAIADPSEDNIALCLDRMPQQARRPAIYADWRDMLRREAAFDAMIVATPNFLHYAPAMAVLDTDVRAIALEKPLASHPDHCREIVQKADARGIPVQLGFVMRSAPFFSKVKELLVHDAIGQILSIQADELVSPRVTSVNFRGPWRRFAALSGGSLLEKCCHDMDLLTWFANARPASVSSFGGLGALRPNAFLPGRCTAECPISGDCRYFVENEQMRPVAGKTIDRCIFNAGGDVVDHQSVQIQYENGVICNFMLHFNVSGERSGRNLHIVGTRGRIWGHESGTVVMQHDLVRDVVTEHPFTVDGSGHAGGNRNHAEAFLRLAAGVDLQPVVSTYDAYLSAMLCFAADRSRIERRQVGLRFPGARTIEII